MAYQVLARKWRPKRFQDVIGQKHITQSLQNILQREKIGQAYIFTGTRGIGKTSVARLFAKALRCLSPDEQGNPCGQCDCCYDFDSDSSMNVIEIDGASNNGVDNIRELISEVQYLPSVGKYKVYIIDEVHMVTTQAFNALLKTLEEPPAHVVFLFATTEPEKLMGTVLSRCQRFDFRHASVPDLTDHLKMIAQSEGIHYQSEELLRQIAAQGKGSVRDTLSLLDQVLSFSLNNNITEETLVVSLGMARTSAITQMIEGIFVGDAQLVSSLYRSLLSENVTVKNILISLHDMLFELIGHPEKIDPRFSDLSQAELFWIYEALAKDSNWALESIDPDRVTEIILQKICLRRSFFEGSNSPRVAEGKKKLADPEPVITASVEPKQQEEPPAEVIEEKHQDAPDEFEPVIADDVSCEQFMDSLPVEAPAASQPQNWEGFLQFLRQKSPLTSSYLEQGNIIEPVSRNGNMLVVRLGFDSAGGTFYEYFEERESREKVVNFLSQYFDVSDKMIDLRIELIEEDNFVSRAQINEEKITNIRENKKQELLDNPIVKEAKELFSGTIDRVVLRDEIKEK